MGLLHASQVKRKVRLIHWGPTAMAIDIELDYKSDIDEFGLKIFVMVLTFWLIRESY